MRPFRAAEDGAKVTVLKNHRFPAELRTWVWVLLVLEQSIRRIRWLNISVEKAFNMFMEYTYYQADARLSTPLFL